MKMNCLVSMTPGMSPTHSSSTSPADIELNRWVSKAFLDILHEHIIPNLNVYYASQVTDSPGHSFGCAKAPPSVLGHAWPDLRERPPEGRGFARQAQAAIALVCTDWAVAQRQAEQEVVQVRLWDGGQVRSLASYLRRRSRVTSLRLQSPQPDVTDAPGMVAAVGDLLYGSPAGGSAAAAAVTVAATSDAGAGTDAAAAAAAGAAAADSRAAAVNGMEPDSDGRGRGGEDGQSGRPAPTYTAGAGGGPGAGPEHGGGALPSSLHSLEADGPTAVPLLLLAAAELPHLAALSLSQPPAAWTYVEGALPWPPHAEARLRELLPAGLQQRVADTELYKLIYGLAVNRRFNSYWSSYDGALAALLLLRGPALRELSLEAPARSVGLHVLDLLVARGGCRLESLRLRAFGLRREAHQDPRVPLERAGLRLAAGLGALAAPPRPTAPPAKEALGRQQGQQHPHLSHEGTQHQQRQHDVSSSRPPSSSGAATAPATAAAAAVAAVAAEAEATARDGGCPPLPGPRPSAPRGSFAGPSAGSGCSTDPVHHTGDAGGGEVPASSTASGPKIGIEIGARSGGGGGGGSWAADGDGDGSGRGPLLLPPCNIPGVGTWGGGGGGGVPGGVLTHGSLTRLELLACGCEPLDAAVLEGLTSLRVLSLRDSCFTWRDRPPDLGALRHLRSLDLRRSNWLGPRSAPWDEQLLLPTSLEALDLIGFSSLTSADLSSLDHLTALADLSDITLQPDPADFSNREPLQPPYANVAALTCMLNVRLFVGRGGSGGVRRWHFEDSEDEDEEEEEESHRTVSTASDSSSSGRGAGGRRCAGSDSSSSSSTEGSVRHGGSAAAAAAAAAARRRRCRRQQAQRCMANRGLGSGGSGSGSGSCLDRCKRDVQISRLAGSGSAAGSSSSSGGSGSSGSNGGSSAASLHPGGSSMAAAGVAQPAPLPGPPPAFLDAPLVSLTLYCLLPQHVADLFPALPLLTRLVFSGGDERERLAVRIDSDREDDGVGQLALRAGELPRLRELELSLGLLGYGQLALGPATSLTKLVVDDVEYVDVRYIELPPSLQDLRLIAWFGLPELYYLAEGPPLSTALARAAAGRMERAARGRGGGHGGGGGGGGGSSEDDDSVSGEWPRGSGGGGAVETLLGLSGLQDVAPNELNRALEVEVERQLVQRLLPPLRQLRVLQLNWDVVTHGPVAASSGGGTKQHASAAGGRGNSTAGTASRWPFPHLPLLEELNVPWMQELPEEDLSRLLSSCPSLRGVSHGNGSRRAARGPQGTWLRRCVGSP